MFRSRGGYREGNVLTYLLGYDERIKYKKYDKALLYLRQNALDFLPDVRLFSIF
jgi:hypothetical protein